MHTAVNSLQDAWRIQRRVVKALFFREVMTRYGRHNLGLAWLFIEPTLFTVGVAALWAATKALHGGSIPIIAFAITGYSSVLLWRNCSGRCVAALEPNLTLLYHRSVKVIDVYLARLILEIAGATLSFFLLTVTFTFLGMIQPPVDLIQVMFGWLLLAWFGSALGLFVGGLSERTEIVERVWHVVTYLLFPLSGAMTMVDWLPPNAQAFVLLLPMVHGVEFLREGFFGSLVRCHYDLEYLMVCNGVLSLAGLMMVRVAANRVETQ
jgi:capsular polysaccharide transport system permease protein